MCCAMCIASLRQRRLEERRDVPDPQRQRMQRPGDRGAVVTRPRPRDDRRVHEPAPASRRCAGGSAQVQTPSGRPSTSSGAATTISSSCCTMCAENSRPPSASSGDTSAATSASQPAANARRLARRAGRARRPRGRHRACAGPTRYERQRTDRSSASDPRLEVPVHESRRARRPSRAARALRRRATAAAAPPARSRAGMAWRQHPAGEPHRQTRARTERGHGNVAMAQGSGALPVALRRCRRLRRGSLAAPARDDRQQVSTPARCTTSSDRRRRVQRSRVCCAHDGVTSAIQRCDR